MLLLVQNSRAQISIETNWLKTSAEAVASNKLQSMVLQVRNPGDTTVRILSEFETPRGWFSMSLAPDTIDIPPLGFKNIVYSYRINNHSNLDQYHLQVRLLDLKGNLLVSHAQTVKVIPTFKVLVEPVKEVNYVSAGEIGYSTYRIVNRGNTTVNLKLRTNECEITGPDTMTLAPGKSKEVEVQLKTTSNLGKAHSKSYFFKVESKEFDTSLVIMRKTEIFPNSSYVDDPYVRFPVSLSLNYLGRHGQKHENAFQLDAFGRKVLNDSIGDILEFHLRGPDRVAYSAFGNFDEYYISYFRRGNSVTVGDHVLRVSQLTEQSRYIRGVSGSYNVGKFKIQAAYGKPRFFPDVESVSSTSISYTGPKNILTVGGVLLAKQFNSEESEFGLIPALQTIVQLRNVRIETEVASSKSENTQANAYKVLLNGNIKKFNYSGSYMKADPHFLGFFQNSTIANASLSYSWNKIGININTSYNDANPALDTLFINSPLSYHYLGGIYVKMNDRQKIRLYGGQRRRKDRMPLSRFDYVEDVVRLTYTYSAQKGDFSLYSEVGRNENFKNLNDREISTSYTLGGNGGFRFNDKFGLTANVIYLDNLRYSQERYRNINVGGGMHWSPSPLTHINLSYQNSYDIEQYYQIQDFFVLSVGQQMGSKQHISLNARYTKPQRQISNPLLFVSARYTYRLDFPMRKKKDRGQIRGYVFTADSIPAKNVMLIANGHKAITDDQGKYLFKSLKAGTYFMHLDRSSIGADQISEEPEPMMVEVHPDRASTKNVKLVKVAHITGKLLLPESKGLLHRPDEKPSPTYIRITNGSESYIKEADSSGTFIFPNLRPGEWKINIIKSTIDPSIIFDRNSTKIKLEEGERAKVEFKARRKQRKLKMMDNPIKLTAKVKDSNDGTD